MFLRLYICLFFGVILAQTDNLFEDFNDFSNSTEATTKSVDLKNITFERIVTPVGITPTSVEDATTQLSLNISKSNKDKRDFRPSPHLGTYYDEPNQFPEAKHSPSFLNEVQKSPWTDRIQLITESSWTTKVKFPTEMPEVVIANDHPYPFVKDEGASEKNGGVTTYEFITISNPGHGHPYYGIPSSVQKFPQPQIGNFQKNFPMEQKSVLNNIPWKKIVKFLSAAIPIGLFIGALTPNVINISPVNDTQSRARLEENESRTQMQLIYSSKLTGDLQKKDCRRRILCELLLSAGLSKNGEEYAENFLELFMEQETDIQKKANELRKMLGAVKKGNCKEFRCESRKKHVN